MQGRQIEARGLSKVVPVSSCPLASWESAPRWVSEDRQQVQGALQTPPGPAPDTHT